MVLPDGTKLEVFRGAPTLSLRISPLALHPLDVADTGAVVFVSEAVDQFMGTASGYLAIAQFAAQVLEALMSLFDESGPSIATLSQQLSAVMVQVAANDYLARLRAMDGMRGNAETVIDLLSSIGAGLQGDSKVWYTTELQNRDAQLHSDINTLLEPAESYFRRTYVESYIAGDGNWLQVIPDRPVDKYGIQFDHSVAMPTVLLLISLRLGMMKFTMPNFDFVSSGVFQHELDHYWRRLQQLSDKMAFHVKKTPIRPIAVQAARRQAAGQTLGDYQDWETHLTIPPPYSLSPVGAVDIATGFGTINWEYTQFDEWYLGQGDLHGGNAGYWPPSVGPQWYKPPVRATGLPPLDQDVIQRYYTMADKDATTAQGQVQDQIGTTTVSKFAWMLAELAYPGAPI